MIDVYLCYNNNEPPKLIFIDSINLKDYTNFQHYTLIGTYQLNDIIAIPVYKCTREKDKLLPNTYKNLVLQIIYVDNYNKKFTGKDMFNGNTYTFSPVDIISKSYKYWFFNSKGQICTDYLFRHPFVDKFRMIVNNFFQSYSEAAEDYKNKCYQFTTIPQTEDEITIIKKKLNL